VTERFPLAPMSRGIRWLTWGLLTIPLWFLGLSWGVPGLSLFSGIAALLVALYAAIWVWWRPSSFDVTESGLRIRFPGATRSVAGSQIASVRILTSAELYAEAGFAVRIGVGGLWGGFGWLWTQRRGFVEFYVSRVDGLVWIERRAGRPLLVTPGDAEGFARALEVSAKGAPREAAGLPAAGPAA
jgi:hypothetical protein